MALTSLPSVPLFSGGTQFAQFFSSTTIPGTSTIPCRGAASALIQIVGTFTGTISFQASMDGTTYFALTCINLATGTAVSSTTATAGQWLIVNCAGFTNLQLSSTATASGTVTAIASLSKFLATNPY